MNRCSTKNKLYSTRKKKDLRIIGAAAIFIAIVLKVLDFRFIYYYYYLHDKFHLIYCRPLSFTIWFRIYYCSMFKLFTAQISKILYDLAIAHTAGAQRCKMVRERSRNGEQQKHFLLLYVRIMYDEYSHKILHNTNTATTTMCNLCLLTVPLYNTYSLPKLILHLNLLLLLLLLFLQHANC